MEREYIQDLVDQLVAAETEPFPIAGRPDAPQRGGVYIIRTPRGVIDHVGSTYRAKLGIQQRLYDHLTGRSSYVIKAHRRKGRRLRELGYTFATLVIPHERTRSLVEHAAIGRLCPRHLGTHQKAGR